MNRRTFVVHAIVAGGTFSSIGAMGQAAGPKVEESDPQAVALGYKHDTKAVDAKKYPKHEASQDCANCQLFQGKAQDEWGGCPLFAGKQVAAKGWCSAWVKKAG
jgi:hypothetical protein